MPESKGSGRVIGAYNLGRGTVATIEVRNINRPLTPGEIERFGQIVAAIDTSETKETSDA